MCTLLYIITYETMKKRMENQTLRSKAIEALRTIIDSASKQSQTIKQIVNNIQVLVTTPMFRTVA